MTGLVPLYRSALVTLKHHRVEVATAVVASLAVGIAAFVVAWRLGNVPMPTGCFDAWRAAPGGVRRPDCDRAIQLWRSIRDEEAAWVFRALWVLPLFGLVAGIPIVGRELEDRTAQIAWSLAGSRGRWLFRQVMPVLLLVGLSATFAALGADVLQGTQPDYEVIGLPLHGPILVGRMLGALLVGVLAGALVGRTLISFVVALVFCVGLAAAAEPARLGWLRGQVTIVGEVASAYPYSFGVFLRAPDGGLHLLDSRVAASIAPAGVEDPESWLYDHGYALVQVGVTDQAAQGWIPYETALWSALGAASLAAAGMVIDRRRPT
jgi:hypothetical protein